MIKKREEDETLVLHVGYNFFCVQGFCEQTVKVLQLMEAEGIEPNIVMLNVLINAFGIAGRHEEALSIYQHIRESVRLYVLQGVNFFFFFFELCWGGGGGCGILLSRFFLSLIFTFSLF